MNRILIIHNEATYFAGAERVLEYFLAGVNQFNGLEISVATPEGGALASSKLGSNTTILPIRNDRRHFSIQNLYRQANFIRKLRHRYPFELIHGWAARDWELTALVGKLTGLPTLGTLHDHPNASFISPWRQRLMGWSARLGLRKVVCVSEAVRQACIGAGYSRNKLDVVRNGLPASSFQVERSTRRWGETSLRLGYLGAFSPRKGFRGLFEIVSELAKRTTAPWELLLAGSAQDQPGEAMIAEIKSRYSDRPWWPHVKWLGWTDCTGSFLSSIDLLVCPSSEFDPFPTVLLESGAAGTTALASNVGGVAEIVQDGNTGWLFQSGDWKSAANTIAWLIKNRAVLEEAGALALRRIRQEFSIEKMVSNYRAVYSNLA